MKRREKIFWSVVGAALGIGFLSLIPSYYEICSIDEAKKEHCTLYQAVPFAFIKIAKFLDAAGAVITALATIAIAGFTLTLKRATDKLWKAGENQIAVALKAANAAEKSANIAERSLTKLQRAFVFVKEINVLEDRDRLTGLPYQYRMSAVLENSGQTPAVRMIYNLNCGYIATANILTFNFKDQSSDVSRGVLGPKATLQTLSKRMSPANIDEIKRGNDRWFIWGWVDYDNIFENTSRHRMEFCFEVAVRPLASGEIFLGFPMHNKFNATDDDCLRKPAPYAPA